MLVLVLALYAKAYLEGRGGTNPPTFGGQDPHLYWGGDQCCGAHSSGGGTQRMQQGTPFVGGPGGGTQHVGQGLAERELDWGEYTT